MENILKSSISAGILIFVGCVGFAIFMTLFTFMLKKFKKYYEQMKNN